MNLNSQAIGFGIVVMSAVVSFALLPQPDFTISPAVKFVLGILNVALTTAALYLKVTMPGASK